MTVSSILESRPVVTEPSAAAVKPLRPEVPSQVWKFTITHGPLDLPGRRCIERIDKLARADFRFVECRRLTESSCWVFEGNAGVLVIALHGLAVREGQHFWRLETLTGAR